MIRKLFFIILLPLVFLSGCWDVDEIDRMLYIHAVGVDYKDGYYYLYGQLLNVKSSGTSSSSKGNGQAGGGQVPAIVGIGKGKTVDEAAFDFYKNLPRRLFWGHLSAIIFSEEALKQKDVVFSTLDVFDRYRETRYTLWISTTPDSVEKLLSSVFLTDISPLQTRISDPMHSYEQNSFIQPKRLKDFLLELNEPSFTAILPLIEVVDSYWKDGGKTTSPGLRINGVSLVSKKDGFNGTLTGTAVKGLRWLTPEAGRNDLMIFSDGSPVASIVFEKPKLKIVPEVKDGNVRFNLKVEMKGTVSELFQEKSEKTLNQLASKAIKKEIKHTYQAALDKNVDIYKITEQLYRTNPKEWKKVTLDGNINPLKSDSLNKIEVKAKINTTGKIELKRPE
ncbi:Ger(x)C family spore germination protein [Pseudalkalibacillus caeni]|uniref:Ger(X)C family spore germination protein n=1 Tax=Exobacillus caeni TaxID=2574798 RepID=A0A5R9F9A7_9BACL|nr:Ger(x)C family spore germination protein [Pseudalkalibacillus caeni]TLS37134.1 Ger(x)C family spore germination protein [Pseudalkalibacillus caeni]